MALTHPYIKPTTERTSAGIHLSAAFMEKSIAFFGGMGYFIDV
jgi:hypothetical protein